LEVFCARDQSLGFCVTSFTWLRDRLRVINGGKWLVTQQVGEIERKSLNYVRCIMLLKIWLTSTSATSGQGAELSTALWRIAHNHHGIRVELLTGFVGHVS